MNTFYVNIVVLRRKALTSVHYELITEVRNSEESVGIKSACYIMSKGIPVNYQYKYNRVIGYKYMYVFVMCVIMYVRVACTHNSCI